MIAAAAATVLIAAGAAPETSLAVQLAARSGIVIGAAEACRVDAVTFSARRIRASRANHWPAAEARFKALEQAFVAAFRLRCVSVPLDFAFETANMNASGGTHRAAGTK